ncbi:hypothetical protein TRFO_03526 [Tritrichomonas foetus]|uniref:Uncharacterized protein n=1 Tax=Tritrichomonas foetus TaxID=1144522 RepID=A0A1J4KP69_9EUKA|nr:hypothetical protein TRFO_03526 [Tritrichomonas foetus]|eukprot:OHT13087.1 hypothetical protein TRFO_03526 [Tritrichomonas foetus]
MENNIIRNPKKKEFQQPSLETKVKNLYLSLEAKIKENELLKEEIVVLKKLKEESDSNNLIYKNEIEKVTKLNLDLHNQNKEFEKLLENQKLINEKLMAEKSSNEKNPNQNLINKESLENENNKNKNNSNICSDKTQNHVTNEEFEKMKNELAALTSKVKEFSNVNCQLSKDNKMLQSIVKNLKIEIETDKKVRENENLIHSKEFENLKAKNLSNENRMKNLLNENEKLKKLISVYEKKISLSEHEISLLNLPNKREKTQKKKIVIDELLKEIP